MQTMSRRAALGSLLAGVASAQQSGGWVPLFDGRSLKGWKAGDNAPSFRVEDGCIVADGPRSHLFYDGEFRNFELKADVMTRPGANSGIYFHTRFQQGGWPAEGFEVQVNNTYTGEGGYLERKKTGSLYGVRDVYKALAKDDQWFQMHVLVRGKQVQIRLNGMLLVDYVEPQGVPARVGHGTFALQCHNQGSRVRFRNLLVKPLPDGLTAQAPAPVADDVYRQIVRMHAANYPVVDYHVHLKGGLTLEQALENSRRVGIGYGIAINCGVGFTVSEEAGVKDYLASMKGQPAFVAMQGEGREWVKLVSPETVAQFDYVFTDSMTFTDDRGKRMRTWIKEEVGEIPDAQAFMETLVDRTQGILNREPIDIYVNPTFLPDVIAADYDRLWTPERMRKVVDGLARNGVAMEINNRYKLPSAAFIRMAKKAGVKFSFGTNNGDRELGRMEYALQMVNECGLGWQDIFVPKPDGQKPVQKKGMPA